MKWLFLSVVTIVVGVVAIVAIRSFSTGGGDRALALHAANGLGGDLANVKHAGGSIWIAEYGKSEADRRCLSLDLQGYERREATNLWIVGVPC